MNERFLNKTENTIRVGIRNIRDGKQAPKDSGLGKLLNAMKTLDEPLYEELMEMYKKALQSPLCKK